MKSWCSWVWQWTHCCWSIRDMDVAMQNSASFVWIFWRLLCFQCLSCHYLGCTRNHQHRLFRCHVWKLVIQTVMTQKVCKVINCNLLVTVPASKVESVSLPSICDANPKDCCDDSKVTILCLPVLLKPKQELMHMIVLINSIWMQKVLIDCCRSRNTSTHVSIWIHPACFVVACWLCRTYNFCWNETQDLFGVVLVANC